MKKFFIGLVFVALFTCLTGASPGPEKQNKPEKEKKGMKPALLVIDIQNAFLPMMDAAEKDQAMKMINYMIHLFRSQGFVIIRVYHTDLTYGPKSDSDAFQFPKSVQIQSDDPMIIKNYGNAFKKTDLEKILREKGVNTLFLCGLSSVGCVISTYFGALDLDFEAFLLKDALISHNAKYTKSIEEIFSALGYRALKVMLENAHH